MSLKSQADEATRWERLFRAVKLNFVREQLAIYDNSIAERQPLPASFIENFETYAGTRHLGASSNEKSTNEEKFTMQDYVKGLRAIEGDKAESGQERTESLQDHQAQLMMLEQQNKKRLLMARAEQDEREKESKEAALQDYQAQLMMLEPQNKKRLLMARAEQDEREKESKEAALQDYQTQMMMLEQQNKKRLLMARAEQDELEKESKEATLQDYQTQMMLLEQQNKKRLLMARAEQDELEEESKKESEEESEEETLQDYQTRMMMLEQHNIGLIAARREHTEDRQGPTPEDIQARLIMQEQQYQTRLLLERQQQDGGERGSFQEQDHQMHLMLLEQQNKQRLLISRRQQEYSERGIPLGLSGAVFDLRDAEQEETVNDLTITGQKLSWGSEAAHYIAKARQEYDTARGSEAAAGSMSLPQASGEHIIAELPVTAEEHTAPGISY